MRNIRNPLCGEKYTYVTGESALGNDNPTNHVFEVRRTFDDALVSRVNFHSGSFSVNTINGLLNEDLMIMLIDRLESFQKSKLKCRENEAALQHLYEALFWMNQRQINKKGE